MIIRFYSECNLPEMTGSYRWKLFPALSGLDNCERVLRSAFGASLEGTRQDYVGKVRGMHFLMGATCCYTEWPTCIAEASSTHLALSQGPGPSALNNHTDYPHALESMPLP